MTTAAEWVSMSPEKRSRVRALNNARTREYRRRHPERLKEITRRSYLKNREQKMAYFQKYRAEGRHVKNARVQAWRRQGIEITWDEYEALRKAQGEACKLCGKSRQLAVDHDHATGYVRGLLCAQCNTGIGHLGDNVEGLERAIAYLRGV